MTIHHILDPSTLTPLIGRLLDEEQIALSACAVQPLEGGFSGSPFYRVQGQATTRAGERA